MFNLHYSTVTPRLHQVLNDLMQEELFNPFRLVGGTSLSLQMGHRMSDDVDLFTDLPYDSLDFTLFDQFFEDKYSFVQSNRVLIDGMGRSYLVGESENDYVKVDLFYTEDFIREYLFIDGIRLASPEDIIAMKLDVVQRGGRKKDFWDIHELTAKFNIDQMLSLHEERYPYNHDVELIKSNFIHFNQALIKMDLVDFVDIDSIVH